MEFQVLRNHGEGEHLAKLKPHSFSSEGVYTDLLILIRPCIHVTILGLRLELPPYG